MFPRSAVVAVVCCFLLLTMPLTAAVGAQETTTGSSTTGTDSGTVDRCFVDDGYEFTIGTQGPEIRMVIHLSLLTNLGGPGALGVELSGSTGGPPIIELKTGVIFDGFESLSGFLNDPFGPFSIAYDYQFELPMFGSDVSYDDTETPIDGPVGNASCEFA
ncbi:hypothetical protein halTADL_1667 [Halohasta litchfieldiae]|jgi:hypothetical protein|uniref:Uncharacterized protein n=1 Tax=Halohasta litchfieldiae TaxID=1073996 RepID=A0A1H6URF2_9EURY|nr:hypothetical protein [Halohasta litchfieldiae]ATW88422.1 hypothetical protein halTADL_1667 [Halohasta litchfieldiae]SEI94899.1 hypothetical protein SAMN05444271_11324 [Halohasta litchfieldiae]